MKVIGRSILAVSLLFLSAQGYSDSYEIDPTHSNINFKNNMSVKAKKHLGQHFLTDENIAKKIPNFKNSNSQDDYHFLVKFKYFSLKNHSTRLCS